MSESTNINLPWSCLLSQWPWMVLSVSSHLWLKGRRPFIVMDNKDEEFTLLQHFVKINTWDLWQHNISVCISGSSSPEQSFIFIVWQNSANRKRTGFRNYTLDLNLAKTNVYQTWEYISSCTLNRLSIIKSNLTEIKNVPKHLLNFWPYSVPPYHSAVVAVGWQAVVVECWFEAV